MSDSEKQITRAPHTRQALDPATSPATPTSYVPQFNVPGQLPAQLPPYSEKTRSVYTDNNVDDNGKSNNQTDNANNIDLEKDYVTTFTADEPANKSQPWCLVADPLRLPNGERPGLTTKQWCTLVANKLECDKQYFRDKEHRILYVFELLTPGGLTCVSHREGDRLYDFGSAEQLLDWLEKHY